MDQQFPVAMLQEEYLKKIKKMENELSEETGEEIVLIAYQHQQELN